MKTSKLIRKAAAVIADPEHWTKGVNARTGPSRGARRTTVLSLRAKAFCGQGAVLRVTSNRPKDARKVVRYLIQALNMICPYVTDSNPVAYNDAPDRKHDEVMEMFVVAHAWAKAQGD